MPPESTESEERAPAAGGDTTAVIEAPEPEAEAEAVETPNPQDLAAFEKAVGPAEGDEKPEAGQPEPEPEAQTPEPEETEGEPPAQPDYSKSIAAFEKVQLPEGRLEAIKADPESAAMTAILRDGMSRADLEQWIDRDIEGMVNYGLKRLAAQHHVDTFQGKLAQAEAKAASDDNGKTPEPPDVVAILNLNETIDPIIDKVKQTYDEDLAGHFKAGLEAVTRKLGNAVIADLSGQQKAIESLGTALEQAQLEAARHRLSESYPQLKDEDHFEKAVLPFYRKLVKTGEYRSPGDALADAARASSNAAGLEELQAKMASRQARRKASQPRTKGVATSPDKKEVSAIEADRAVFDRVMARQK